jgi:hypothetical protein
MDRLSRMLQAGFGGMGGMSGGPAQVSYHVFPASPSRLPGGNEGCILETSVSGHLETAATLASRSASRSQRHLQSKSTLGCFASHATFQHANELDEPR